MTVRSSSWRYASLSALACVLSGPAQAHHSGAVYDTSKQVQLVGTVQDFRWANPHVWLEVLASEGGNRERTWHVEAGSIGMMARTGWTRAALKPGDKVTVTINPVRTGETEGALVRLITQDGRTFGGGVPTPPLPMRPSN